MLPPGVLEYPWKAFRRLDFASFHYYLVWQGGAEVFEHSPPNNGGAEHFRGRVLPEEAEV